MTSASISVVVPTHGRPDYLERALRSVLGQTILPAEIIVVDDNADDAEMRGRTREAVDRVARDTSAGLAIQTHETTITLGGAGARNAGVENATGDLIAFLDDDDWWEPKKLERQLDVFSECRKSLGLVYTGRRIVDDQGQTKRVHTATMTGYVGTELLRENFIGTTSCAIIPRSVFDQVEGFDATLPARQDLDLWYRIARRYEIAAVDAPLTVQQEHSGGRITRSYSARVAGMEMFIAKYEKDLRENRELLALQYTTLAAHHLKYNHPLRGRKQLLKAFIASPTIRRLLRLVRGQGLQWRSQNEYPNASTSSS